MHVFTRLSAIALAVVLVAASCSDDGGNDASTTTTVASPATDAPTTTVDVTTTIAPTTTVAAARVSDGCGASVESGAASFTLDTADGRTRDYRMYTPPVDDPDAALPVVLNFHGFTSDIDAQVGLSRLEPLAETEGFIVITPQGTVNANGVPFWNSGGRIRPTELVDGAIANDVQFIHELLDAVEASRCVDLDRVFSTGMSNGGSMSGQLACQMPERIAAIASVTGLARNVDCADDRDVAVLHFHGTDDRVAAFDSFPDRVAGWAADNGCDDTFESEEVSAEVERRIWSCPDGAGVEFYVVAEGGHTWPGTPLTEALTAILGYTTLDIDATALAWEWFQAHPMRAWSP